jgi:catechol 2,3-dioxygenase-like lactoylglutathione lyase family enzyme
VQVLKPHVSLNVTDVSASAAFYEKVFGVAPAKRRPGYAKFDLASPSLNLTMMEAPRTGENASHFGIQVASTDDVNEAKAAFELAGLTVKAEEQVSCCYAVQDKVWVTDPDGNEWEVFTVTVTGDAPTLERRFGEKAESGASCCAPTCCTPAAETKPIAAHKPAAAVACCSA